MRFRGPHGHFQPERYQTTKAHAAMERHKCLEHRQVEKWVGEKSWGGGQRRCGAEQDAGQWEKESRGRKARGEAAVLTGTSCTAGLSSGRGPGVQSRGAEHGHPSQSQPPRAWHEPGPLLDSQGQQDQGQNVAYLGTWASCQNLLPSIFLFYNNIFQEH